MSDLRETGLENYSLKQGMAETPMLAPDIQITNTGMTGATRQRQKPGPKKKDEPRSEKISCRLTEEEKAIGESYCKAHGTTETKLLRASYLAAVIQTPNSQIERIVDALMQPLGKLGLTNEQKIVIKARATEVLKKASLLLLLILTVTSFAVGTSVAKYVLHVYEVGKSYTIRDGEEWIYHPGDNGWEVVPHKWQYSK